MDHNAWVVKLNLERLGSSEGSLIVADAVGVNNNSLDLEVGKNISGLESVGVSLASDCNSSLEVENFSEIGICVSVIQGVGNGLLENRCNSFRGRSGKCSKSVLGSEYSLVLILGVGSSVSEDIV